MEMRETAARQGVLPLMSAAPPKEDGSWACPDVQTLVGVCVGLGAADVGGPLSPAEEHLVASAPRVAPEIVERVRVCIRSGGDPLGDAISVLRPRSERRSLGLFYTPPEIVRAMVGWVLARAPERVVDPGCGSGRFAIEVVRRVDGLDVVAVDIDPIATLACRANLAVLGARSARVLNGDYVTMEPDRFRGRTAFVGNPPYVRHHRLTPQQKAAAKRLAAELGVRLSGLAGSHVHFLLATLRFGQPGDVGCFITSGEWLNVRYGQVLRDVFLDGLGGQALHLVEPEIATFDDAMTTAVIICFELGSTPRTVRMRTVSSITDLRDLDRGGRAVSKGRLRTAERWWPLFTGQGARWRTDRIRLGEIVRVTRGAVTGANRFFVLTPAEARRLGLEPYVVPALTSATEVLEAGEVVRAGGRRRVLLDPPAELDLSRPEHRALRRYLASGEKQGVADRYVCRHRRPWWRVAAKAPPVVATYMARQPPAFALNPDGLVIVNVLHGLYPLIDLDDDQLLGLVRYLNAHRDGFSGLGRTYQGGLEKFEPREMEAIPIPAPEDLRHYARSHERISGRGPTSLDPGATG